MVDDEVKPVESSVTPPPVIDRRQFNERGEINFDLRCQTCGYSLRGLGELSLCPECGTPVVKSLLTGSIDPRDREWFFFSARGCGLLLLAWAGMLLTVASSFALEEYVETSPPLRIVMIVIASIAYIGLWLMLRPPDVADDHRTARQRSFARYAPVLAAAILFGINPIADTFVPLTPTSRDLLGTLTLAVGMTALALGFLSTIRPASMLAKRLGHDGIGQSAAVFFILMAMLLFGLVLVALFGRHLDMPAGIAFYGLGAICFFALFALFLPFWLLHVLVGYWSALRKALKMIEPPM